MGKEVTVRAPMIKDLLMKYTFIALCIIAIPAIVAFGTPALIMVIIGPVVAIACDFLFSLVMKEKGRFNLYSAAVAGLIVALSFSAGVPLTYGEGEMEWAGISGGQLVIPTIMNQEIMYLAVAGISALAVILFKKIFGLLGRRYVNPAAAAKLVALAPMYATALIPRDHTAIADMSAEAVANFGGLEGLLPICYGGNKYFPDPLNSLLFLKEHGWIGGASSVAVIVVGIALIIASRRYIKWRIPLTFLLTTAIISAGYGWYYGEDVILRMVYHLFIGSSIFLAFFMATDPATTPLTRIGQIIFAIGLSILSFVFQIYLVFLGGSVLALVIMNVSTPLLDRIGIPKPKEERITRKLPKAKRFTNPPEVRCIRCSGCLRMCSRGLSPIMIKEAVDKDNWARVRKLKAYYCEQCGQCSYMCPARIDLKGIVALAKEKTQEIETAKEKTNIKK